jgi:hypothetical protein
MASAEQLAFGISFQISPIILTGGIAANIPGGMLPIVSLTEALSFTTGLLGGNLNDNPDSYLTQWLPSPGSSLIEQKIGEYTFANQATAANAVIRDPLNISMLMIVAAKPGAGYLTKLATITALQASLAQHNNSGGTYTIASPSFIWTDCVMLSMRDASRQDIRQFQNAWRLEFRQPLISLAAAQAAQNSLMSAISNASPTDGSGTGLPQTLNLPPSLATPSVAPAASNLTGAATASGAQLSTPGPSTFSPGS